MNVTVYLGPAGSGHPSDHYCQRVVVEGELRFTATGCRSLLFRLLPRVLDLLQIQQLEKEQQAKEQRKVGPCTS